MFHRDARTQPNTKQGRHKWRAPCKQLPTDGRTDRRTEKAAYRVACTRQKSQEWYLQQQQAMANMNMQRMRKKAPRPMRIEPTTSISDDTAVRKTVKVIQPKYSKYYIRIAYVLSVLNTNNKRTAFLADLITHNFHHSYSSSKCRGKIWTKSMPSLGFMFQRHIFSKRP